MLRRELLVEKPSRSFNTPLVCDSEGDDVMIEGGYE